MHIFPFFLLFPSTQQAIEKATLRMTPQQFPYKSKVEVRGACNISSPHVQGSVRSYKSVHGSVGGLDSSSSSSSSGGDFVVDESVNVYGGDSARDGISTWHEDSLTWNTAPFIYDNEPDKVICCSVFNGLLLCAKYSLLFFFFCFFFIECARRVIKHQTSFFPFIRPPHPLFLKCLFFYKLFLSILNFKIKGDL
jgi:hypothetical protein